MTYLAHISEDGRQQTVLQHLEGTAGACGRFASSFGAEELGRLAGLAHDIGKYSDAFQRRIHGEGRVDHATAGAYECYRRGQPAAAFCVAGHHGGLPDGGGRGDCADLPTFLGRMRRAAEGKLEPYAPWKQEVSPPSPQPPVFQGQSNPLDAFFFTRMLYSCLVDADFLDTEHFMAGAAPPRGNDVSMETLYQRLERYISGVLLPRRGANEVNSLRCAMLERCIQQGDAQKPGLFTLTVPTGGGKANARHGKLGYAGHCHHGGTVL